MHIVLAVAISKDGYINHEGQHHATEWTSKEDQAHFAALLTRYPLQLMGRTTYEHNKDGMTFPAGRRRIVFTHHPDTYTSKPGELTFTDEPMGTVLAHLENEGFKEALLLGGGVLFTELLDAGLVDEAFVTIEPQLFGSGIPFLTNGKELSDYTSLVLAEDKPLNKTGTRLLHYFRS